MNYCTKCGKEIPDGESKICDECKNSLLADLEDAPEEIEEKSSKKPKEKKEKKPLSPKVKIALAILVILVIVAGSIFAYFKFFRANTIGQTIGNNNNNYGYATSQGDWIYYMSFNDDATGVAIYKIRQNGEDNTLLAEGDWEVLSLNAVGDYIYFIAFETVTDEDGNSATANRIYKMSLDGTELTVINDCEFSEYCYAIYVINDTIYYIGEDYNIYSMDTNGENVTQITENECGYTGITDKYILYNDFPENPESETDLITYIMDIDGSNVREINGERLYNPNIIDDYIYYVNEENTEIHRINIDGTDDTLIYETTAYNMNVSGDWIYYMDYESYDADTEVGVLCIYRVKTDGSEQETVLTFDNYSQVINIVDDWIYYTDYDDEGYYIGMIKTDGSEKVNLYTYQFSY